jgi:hypothetical protein
VSENETLPFVIPEKNRNPDVVPAQAGNQNYDLNKILDSPVSSTGQAFCRASLARNDKNGNCDTVSYTWAGYNPGIINIPESCNWLWFEASFSSMYFLNELLFFPALLVDGHGCREYVRLRDEFPILVLPAGFDGIDRAGNSANAATDATIKVHASNIIHGNSTHGTVIHAQLAACALVFIYTGKKTAVDHIRRLCVLPECLQWPAAAVTAHAHGGRILGGAHLTDQACLHSFF